MGRDRELLPNPTDAGTTPGATQPGSAAASGPEPAAPRKAFVANYGNAYRPGYRVRVRVPKFARDPYNGETGTVQSNYNDGGEMVHVVRFEDGGTAMYHYDELVASNSYL